MGNFFCDFCGEFYNAGHKRRLCCFGPQCCAMYHALSVDVQNAISDWFFKPKCTICGNLSRLNSGFCSVDCRTKDRAYDVRKLRYRWKAEHRRQLKLRMLAHVTPEQLAAKRERVERQRENALIRELQITLPEEIEKQRQRGRQASAERTAALRIVKQLQQGILP